MGEVLGVHYYFFSYSCFVLAGVVASLLILCLVPLPPFSFQLLSKISYGSHARWMFSEWRGLIPDGLVGGRSGSVTSFCFNS